MPYSFNSAPAWGMNDPAAAAVINKQARANNAAAGIGDILPGSPGAMAAPRPGGSALGAVGNWGTLPDLTQIFSPGQTGTVMTAPRPGGSALGDVGNWLQLPSAGVPAAKTFGSSLGPGSTPRGASGAGGFDIGSLMSGMSGIGSAMGSMLGGFGGGGSAQPRQQTPSDTAAPTQDPAPAEKPKPNPQRQYAGGYTDQQLEELNSYGSNSKNAVRKSQIDQENIAKWKASGNESYDDQKEARVKAAQARAASNGGQYDSEGNYYAPDVVSKLVAEENVKRAKLDADTYGVPEGAQPTAADGSYYAGPAAAPAPAVSPASPASPGAAAAPASTPQKQGRGQSFDPEWFNKLAGMASGWFQGGW